MPIPEEHMPNGPVPDPEPAPSEPEPEPGKAEDPYAGAVAILSPGTAFTVLKEEGSWWRVESDKGTGWLDHRYCMINLPDVIPSIIYDATNSYGSLFVSSGKSLSGVTGKALYPGKTYNPRLNQKQYMMPVLYATAKKLCAVQHLALSQGNSLKLYEAYRPYQVQRAVVKALKALAASDQTVKAGMSSPWGLGSFIATGYSNHQRGFAVDVGLVKVAQTKVRSVGSSSYLEITEYAEYAMPSAMHELSSAAASTVSPNSKTLASTMNEPAIGLRSYFQSVGMSPLTSEWWHFNDYEARNLASSNLSSGDFIISQCKSRIP